MTSTKQLIRASFEVIKRSSSVAKLMMKRSIMERERKQKFQRLGELTYSLYKTDVLKNQTLSELVSDIDNINREIRTSSTELDGFVR